jgi:serine/threonine protein kinase/formylglycine-generating enzyme required for sulfatase activity
MSTIETFEKLGTGENTVVYRGYDTTLERNVAVKELDPVARADVRRREQFYREAQFLAQHQDENILTVYSVDREQGWIVMELMKGTLASQVVSGPLAPDLVRSVLQQVLRALNFLHKRGKIHGKVRPSNILINDAGRVKLSDFEETDPNGELRIPAGSKKYLAPELLRREFGAFGPYLDLYCLGFTALELLKGPGFDNLFPGTGANAIDSDTAWMRWHTSEAEFPSAGQIIPGVPEDLKVVIDKMLRKQVSERPQSAQAALDLLNDTPLKPVMIESTIPTVPTAAPEPAVVVGYPTAPATHASPSPSAKPKTSGKGTSREQVNDILGRPYVLYPLCALILLIAVFVGLKMRRTNAPSEVQVKLIVEPKDAGLSVDGKTATPDESGAYLLPTGKHQIELKKDGYKSHEAEVEISADLKEIGPITLAKLEVKKPDPPKEPKVRTVDFEVEPADAVVTVDGKELKLDEGKGQLEVAGDALLELKISHPMFQEFANTYQPAQLEQVFNKLAVKLDPLKPEPIAKLPATLKAVESAGVDPISGLPLRVRVAALEEKAPLELVLIPVKEGTVGVDGPLMPGELAAKKVTPSHPFYIAATETTNEQYAIFAEEKGAEVAGTKWRETWEKTESKPDLPVVDVSWEQAVAFSKWCGGQLPSETDWELAARSGEKDGFPYPWGEAPVDATLANLFFGEAGGETQYGLVAVTALSDGNSGMQLQNVLGNAGEWCLDKYTAGEGETADDPEFADQYVVRGCSCAKSAAEDARITYRAPEKNTGAADVGFRLFVPVE